MNLALLKEWDSCVKNFVEAEIALSRKEISEAAASRDWLLRQLKAKIEQNPMGPQLYMPEPFVHYGSYYSGLKVTDVDEFDALVVLDSNTGFYHSQGSTIGQGLGSASPNRLFSSDLLKSDGSGVNPAKLLIWLKCVARSVMVPLGGEVPDRDGPAITVLLKSRGIKIDLVPSAILTRGQTLLTREIFYCIPQGDLYGNWTPTNPRRDVDEINFLGKNHDGFKSVIRIIKFIRDTHGWKLSSYAIQRAAVEYVLKKGWGTSIFLNLLGMLLFLSEKIRSEHISDGFDPNKNLIENTDCIKLNGQVLDVSSKLGELLNEFDSLLFGLSFDGDFRYEKFRKIVSNKTQNAHSAWSLLGGFK